MKLVMFSEKHVYFENWLPKLFFKVIAVAIYTFSSYLLQFADAAAKKIFNFALN